MHTGVHLDVDRHRRVEGPGRPPQVACRVEVEHGEGEVEADRLTALPTRGVAEHQHRGPDTGPAQGAGLGHAGHPELGGPVAQCRVGHLDGAVAVGVGLEHDHDLGIGGPLGQVTRVGSDGRQVDLEPRRPVGLDDADRAPRPVLADQQPAGVPVVGQQLLDHPLHPRRGAPLHQHHRVGTEPGGHLGDGILGGEGDGHPVGGQSGPDGGVGDPGGGVPLGHEQVDDVGGVAPYLAVQLLFRPAEFGHVAEDGDAGPGGQGGKCVEGRVDRTGGGVVRVVEDDAASGTAQRAQAARHPFEAADGGDGVVPVDAEVVGHGQPHERGLGAVGTEPRDGDLGPPGVVDDHERGPVRAHDDVLGPVAGIRRRADTDHRGGAAWGQGQDPGVVGAQHGQPVVGQVGEERALLPGHAVDVAKCDQMGGAHRGHDPDLGRGHGAHGVDLAEVPGGHLDHGDLVLGAQAPERHGQTETPAVIARGAEHREPAGEHVGHQFLGPGLAHGAGDGHHPGCPGSHHVGPVALHGYDGIVDHQRREVVGDARRGVDEDRPGAARDGLGRVVVPVAPLGPHGHEQVAVLDEARVEAEPCVAPLVGGAAHLEAGIGGGQVVEADHRGPVPGISLSASTRSSPWARANRSKPASTIRSSTAQGGAESSSASHCE